VPERDLQPLLDAGVAAVLHPGASEDDVVTTIREVLDLR
jgi:hypothetical protein